MKKRALIIINIIFLITSLNLFAQTTEQKGFLDDKLISFSTRPLINEELSLSVHIPTIKDDSKLFWEFVFSPSNEKPYLYFSNENKTVTFTPLVKGKYILKLTYLSTNEASTKVVEFKVKENLPFDMGNITPPNNIEQNIGTIQNQSWVSSKTLSELEIKTIIKKYNRLIIVGYNQIYGVLIEYDKNDNKTKDQIGKLKQENGIDKVYNRIYEGKNAFEIYPSISPNL